MFFNCGTAILFAVSCAALESLLADPHSTQTDLTSPFDSDTMLTYRSEQQLVPRMLSTLGPPFNSEEVRLVIF